MSDASDIEELLRKHKAANAGLSTGIAHLSAWASTRGKAMVALFAVLGSIGSLVSGGIVGYLSLLRVPTQDQMAAMTRTLEDIRVNTAVAVATVGSVAPRLDKLETRVDEHGNRLAAISGLQVQGRSR